MKAKEFLKLTALHRGTIVSSADCSEAEIIAARAADRFYVDKDTHFGYVWRPDEPTEAEEPKTVVYGHNKTIHGTMHLDVGVDEKGIVREIWYRCLQLPFRQFKARESVKDSVGDDKNLPKILAIEIENKHE